MKESTPIVPPANVVDPQKVAPHKRKKRRRSRNNKGALVATARAPRVKLTLRELQDEIVKLLDLIADQSDSTTFDPSSASGILIVNLLTQIQSLAQQDSISESAFDPSIYRDKLTSIFAATPFSNLIENNSVRLFSTEFIRAAKDLFLAEFTSRRRVDFPKLAQFAMQILYRSSFGKNVNPLTLISSLSDLVRFK